ncbi:MAG TPA: transcription termination factor Rho [Candidatus Woesebacteria bacterium]|mgnify:CR=1 FL=1|nr:transcription termination factor Rho [Candidatus Woesebacteria bacterium]
MPRKSVKTQEVVAVPAIVNNEAKDSNPSKSPFSTPRGSATAEQGDLKINKQEEMMVAKEENNNRVVIVNPQKDQTIMSPKVDTSLLNKKIEVENNPMRLEIISGILEIMPDGQGFVRPKFNPGHKDAVIGSMQIRRYSLRMGDLITGVAKAPKQNEKYWSLVRIDKINGLDLLAAQNRAEFKDLVPIYPVKQVKLEFDSKMFSTRIIDIFCPIGFGQRGMIVSPPKAGKTTLLKEIAAGVAANYPEVHLMAVLVGERPEEVTDMQRFVKGEVIASHFDQKPEEQTRAAEIAIERAKRLVEMGKDVFMVFDSITRLARAYNLAIPTSGRTLSGGFDPAALYPSKKFFGAARKIENGGSLTIIGTALVDTGSKMDELIFEEFKGTGNMELRLERKLAERRIFPAFDILKSGTRKEELLLPAETLSRVMAMRRMFDNLEEKDQMTELIIDQMNKTETNEDFLKKVGKR